MTKQVTALFLTVASISVLFVSISVSVFASSDCDNLKGCEKKYCEIERQLKIAQEKGNKGKVNGLTRSLENAKEHCTDKGLKEDLVEEIEEANNEIVEYESDLKEAKEYGKIDKVRKYQEKIEEEKNKIKHLEDELSNLD
ncbi:MAG: DUF1090 domain-containing protein [gamma proteobacterium symbiont of Taylorina sp.]|nr:DUF1090 domain-containing protein [gamma proteobacterium symbiont of Taylorina sp.]